MKIYRFQKEVEIITRQIEIYEVKADYANDAKNELQKLSPDDAIEINKEFTKRKEEEPELLIVDSTYEEC